MKFPFPSRFFYSLSPFYSSPQSGIFNFFLIDFFQSQKFQIKFPKEFTQPNISTAKTIHCNRKRKILIHFVSNEFEKGIKRKTSKKFRRFVLCGFFFCSSSICSTMAHIHFSIHVHENNIRKMLDFAWLAKVSFINEKIVVSLLPLSNAWILSFIFRFWFFLRFFCVLTIKSIKCNYKFSERKIACH